MDKVIIDGQWSLLPVCEYCGATSCLVTGRRHYCDKCADRMRRYRKAKRDLFKHPSNANSNRLKAIIDEYMMLKAQGYKVPADLQ